jgi:hypothetical protein
MVISEYDGMLLVRNREGWRKVSTKTELVLDERRPTLGEDRDGTRWFDVEMPTCELGQVPEV